MAGCCAGDGALAAHDPLRVGDGGVLRDLARLLERSGEDLLALQVLQKPERAARRTRGKRERTRDIAPHASLNTRRGARRVGGAYPSEAPSSRGRGASPPILRGSAAPTHKCRLRWSRPPGRWRERRRGGRAPSSCSPSPRAASASPRRGRPSRRSPRRGGAACESVARRRQRRRRAGSRRRSRAPGRPP